MSFGNCFLKISMTTGNGDQGDQADNQGNGTNIPADMPEQEAQGNPQAAELPENSKKLPDDF